MNMVALLQTTYFGPVQWYQKLLSYDRCLIEQHDSFQKQTFRNRCVIATANGLQALTVPVLAADSAPADSAPAGSVSGDSLAGAPRLTKDIRISDHNQWRRVHWNALQSAYSESPFFDYYADDIRPFFERRYEYLVDFNEAIRQTVCQLIDLHPTVDYTSEWHRSVAGADDYRDAIHAKHPQPDPGFVAQPYWQVFGHRHGFQPNLSILDLLFCMGPESVLVLAQTARPSSPNPESSSCP